MRLLKRIIIGLISVAALLAVAAWISLTFVLIRPAQYEPGVEVGAVELRPWEEHDAIYKTGEFPYIRRFEMGEGKILYAGIRHTSDASDPQLSKIEALWKEFQPTVALCEGRERMFRFASRPEAGELSESKLVRILAYGSGVPLYSLEPSYESEVAGLLKHFDPDLVAAYMTLRVFTSEAKGNEGDLDSLARHLLQKRIDAPGLEESLTSIGELDNFWRKTFPDAPDWRKLSDTEEIPLMKKVGDVSREVRGEHMIRTIAELASRGERVFAVVGASHVIRQEIALKKVLGDL